MSSFKQIIAIGIIVIIIIITDIILANYTKTNVNDMKEKLKNIDLSLENEDKQAEKEAKELLEKWNKSEKIFNCYIEHSEIEKISDKVNLIEKQIKIESFQDARQAITETQYLLKHIEDKQKFLVENLF